MELTKERLREIDLKVAEKIFGRKVQAAVGVDFVFDEPPPWVVVPSYTSDIERAWHIVETLSKMDPQILQYGEDDGSWTWWVDFEGTNSPDWEELGDDQPLRHRNIATAICLAALMAMGVQP